MELKSHLYVALDIDILAKDKFEELYSIIDEIQRMIFGLIKHLKTVDSLQSAVDSGRMSP